MLVSLHEAFDRILPLLRQQPYETVALLDSLGRVLAKDVSSKLTHPSCDLAATDGYAVRYGDVQQAPVSLKVIGSSTSRDPYSEEVLPGTAIRVFSGSVIPVGADTVIDTEHAQEHDGIISLNEAAFHQGQNIYFAGMDFTEGEACLKAGRIVNARDIGLAAAMNVPWIPVRRRPRIGVVAIGDELAMPGDVVSPDQVIASTNLAIYSFILQCGATPINLGLSADEGEMIERMLEAAQGMDLLLTTGGLSDSARERTVSAMRRKGLEMEVCKINLGISVPVAFGRFENTPVIGMSGSPTAAILCTLLFLQPLVQRMMGRNTPLVPKGRAMLARNLDVNDYSFTYLCAMLSRAESGQLMIAPVSSYDNLMLSSFSRADCLLIVEKGKHQAGDLVQYIPIDYSPDF